MSMCLLIILVLIKSNNSGKHYFLRINSKKEALLFHVVMQFILNRKIIRTKTVSQVNYDMDCEPAYINT